MPTSPKVYRTQPPSARVAHAINDIGRPSPSARGYDAQWRKVRLVVLARDPVCVDCGKRLAVEVDHIKPLSQGGARLDPANLQGLCKPCHTAKTNRERGDILF